MLFQKQKVFPAGFPPGANRSAVCMLTLLHALFSKAVAICLWLGSHKGPSIASQYRISIRRAVAVQLLTLLVVAKGGYGGQEVCVWILE